MEKSLRELVQRKKLEGLRAIQVQKWLRENNYSIPWIETQKAYKTKE